MRVLASSRYGVIAVIACLVVLSDCQAKDARMPIPITPDMAALKPDIAFTCTHEVAHIPPRAYFSDRGRLFQADRGRRFSAIVDAQWVRASGDSNVSQSSTISLK
jgi:hypothetical protein